MQDGSSIIQFPDIFLSAQSLYPAISDVIFILSL